MDNIEIYAPWINFSVVVGILFYIGRKPIADFFKTRHDVLSRAFREAEAVSRAATQAKADSESKLKAAESEMRTRRAEVEEQIKKLKQATMARASHEAERIHKDSQLMVEGEKLRARSALLREIGDDSIASVRKYLGSSLDDKDKDALVTDYLGLVTNGG